MLTLKASLLQRLTLPDALLDAVAEAKRISDFEGRRRRQLQYVGKLMRRLDGDQVAAIEAAIAEQRQGSAAETQRLHEGRALARAARSPTTALDAWRDVEPQADWQRLRWSAKRARTLTAPTRPPAGRSAGAAPIASCSNMCAPRSAPAPIPPPNDPDHERLRSYVTIGIVSISDRAGPTRACTRTRACRARRLAGPRAENPSPSSSGSSPTSASASATH